MNKSSWIFTVIVGLFVASTVQAECLDIVNEVFNNETCTKIKTFKSKKVSKSPVLLVALHGDSPWNNPDYQYRFAKHIADENINLISVGMLRPGYTDPMKRTSDGVRGRTVGDNYDETRIHQIAGAIKSLKNTIKQAG
ncbi:MAG: hypothetical protein HRT38_17470 [Alteromonadaceae bacterium]|nr:hypothetical protein [Alteromonadaceae bacterium]